MNKPISPARFPAERTAGRSTTTQISTRTVCALVLYAQPRLRENVGIVYGSGASVKVRGYHYAIALDTSSPSYADGITSDWGAEDDLEPIDLKEP
ncbi:hypothetical protein H6G00_15675 [Leptolyngbya sp. FACHB-541]|uniref:hypothetical protein n=1 Tax=Leptolyngbya sp. FACHB-541 TaxID=2692810 RepID=UPI00168395F0|nr:hypothetical protein [Leptolyngbya sp. FACHB-541]MBD1998051.1 hypothetical protein [Leptolyngbya sp. FACHB-541]